ncbi:MAG: type I restriction-modification enzyme R subunit C-terminal domain-containing protein [Gammaproteobacteria bacterium]
MKAGRNFNEEQMNWLRAIKDYLAANVEIAPADFGARPAFQRQRWAWWRRASCLARGRTGWWMS